LAGGVRQVPWRQKVPVAHWRLQPPQWLLSFCVSTQVPQ
jgi:hypothetical protein